MAYSDKNLVCKDCGGEFIFTAGEQEFYDEKGFANEPSRCPECRRARRRQNNNMGRPQMERKMYEVVCDECGAMTTVPFQPSGDRPVYCQDCFRHKKPARSWA